MTIDLVAIRSLSGTDWHGFVSTSLSDVAAERRRLWSEGYYVGRAEALENLVAQELEPLIEEMYQRGLDGPEAAAYLVAALDVLTHETEAAMTEPRDPEPEEPDVRNDPIPEPVRETEDDPAAPDPTQEDPQ